MANDGDVAGRKVENDSLGEFDFSCCACVKKNLKTEADKYCSNCLNYFCNECVKLHDMWPALSKHVILDKSEIGQFQNSTKLLQIPTQRCADHRTKIVDMYCKTHDQVGCTTCMALYHDE